MSCTPAALAASITFRESGSRLEPADVVLDRRIHQADFLRKIADMLADLLLAPLRQISAVQPDAAAQHRPDAGERAHHRGLSAGAGSDDAERLAGLELEGDIAQDDLAGTGHRDRDLLHAETLAGTGSFIGSSAAASATTVSRSR